MCRGSRMYFSMYIPSFPKAAADSCLAESQADSNSDSSHTIRMPFPPPPAVALRITGYLISFAIFFASGIEVNKPFEPGIQGTPAFIIVALADALSPIPAICSGKAPINLMPCS